MKKILVAIRCYCYVTSKLARNFLQAFGARCICVRNSSCGTLFAYELVRIKDCAMQVLILLYTYPISMCMCMINCANEGG